MCTCTINRVNDPPKICFIRGYTYCRVGSEQIRGYVFPRNCSGLNESASEFVPPEHLRGGTNMTPATTGIPRHPYEGCTYCFIHEEAHTNVRFLSCDGHQLYELGVDLEVEGVRYIEMHRGPAEISN